MTNLSSAAERQSKQVLFEAVEAAAKGEPAPARMVSARNLVQVRAGSRGKGLVVASCHCNDDSAASVREAERTVIESARRQGWRVLDENGEVI